MRRNLPALMILAFSTAILAQAFLPAFEDVDVNGDGEISRDEAGAVEGLDYEAADVNQDGGIDREEYAAVRNQ